MGKAKFVAPRNSSRTPRIMLATPKHHLPTLASKHGFQVSPLVAQSRQCAIQGQQSFFTSARLSPRRSDSVRSRFWRDPMITCSMPWTQKKGEGTLYLPLEGPITVASPLPMEPPRAAEISICGGSGRTGHALFNCGAPLGSLSGLEK